MSNELASRLVLAAVIVGALFVLAPFWSPLLLGVYMGLATHGLMMRLLPWVRSSRAVAASITVLAVAAVSIPLAIMVTSLVIDAVGFVQVLLKSHEIPTILQNLATADGSAAPTEAERNLAIRELIERYSERAFEVIQYVAGAAVIGILKLLVFFVTLYSVLVAGEDGWRWLLDNSPLRRNELARYGAAFVETGRGLVVGFGTAALVQGIIAMIVFAALGVSQAVVLGVLTVAAAIVPSIGTAVVWLPVAAGLALTDRTEAAIVLVIVGMVVISSIDNLIKPVLARRAALQLPASVVLVSMLGGLLALGPTGIIVGPLAVRLAREGLVIRGERLKAEAEAAATAPVAPTDG